MTSSWLNNQDLLGGLTRGSVAKQCYISKWNNEAKRRLELVFFLLFCSTANNNSLHIHFKDFIYLSLERGKGRKKRGRETSVCGCLSHAPHWGPGLQSRHVPPLGIELATFWFNPHGQPLRHNQRVLHTMLSILKAKVFLGAEDKLQRGIEIST